MLNKEAAIKKITPFLDESWTDVRLELINGATKICYAAADLAKKKLPTKHTLNDDEIYKLYEFCIQVNNESSNSTFNQTIKQLCRALAADIMGTLLQNALNELDKNKQQNQYNKQQNQRNQQQQNEGGCMGCEIF